MTSGDIKVGEEGTSGGREGKEEGGEEVGEDPPPPAREARGEDETMD